MPTTSSNPWTPAEDAIIKARFESCKSLKEVLPFLPGRTYNALRTRANAYLGLKMKRLPQHNRTYFDIPTEVNCALAGYIAADAYISPRGRLTFNISSKDRAHLVTFTNLVGFTGRIYDYTRAYTNLKVKKYGKVTSYDGVLHIACVQIQCPEVCTKLNEHWNITTLKTRTLRPPNLTNDRLIMAYLSGFIDGDGWMVEDNSAKHTQYSIGVMGTKEMMEWTKVIFDRLVPGAHAAELQPTESENIYDYKVSGVMAYWLAKIFLSLDVPRLDRKWDKLRRLVKRVETGVVSQKFQATVVKCCPSVDTLARFGLTEGKDRLFATIRPSVA